MISLGLDTLTPIMNSDSSFKNIYWDGPIIISNWLGNCRNSVPFLWFGFVRYVMKNKLSGLSSDQIVVNELLLSYANEINWSEIKTKILTLSNEYQRMNVCHAFCIKLFSCNALHEAEECQYYWQQSIDEKELNKKNYKFYCNLHIKAKDSEVVYNHVKEDENNIFMSDSFQKFDAKQYSLYSNIYQLRMAKKIIEFLDNNSKDFSSNALIEEYSKSRIPSYNIFNYNLAISIGISEKQFLEMVKEASTL